ncbi:MAG TPA: NYN domain-containing protein [Candidatus Saccharimonadales bacterium]|nr:NYN domain-containing protein [Candidatus Saccharimonadales bacterium]
MAQSKKAGNNFAFIDSQNLNLGTQRMGWKMDWRKFRELLRSKYGVSQAYMFIGYMSGNESLYEYMHELGYLVVLKPTVDVSSPHEEEAKQETAKSKDDHDKPAVKGNIDADLVLYAMKELPNYQKALIVSGDGDFFSLVEYLEEKGKLANILTPNWQYSSLLKPFENKIVRLDQQRKQLAYHDRKKRNNERKDNA